jgi:hypothetical protein
MLLPVLEYLTESIPAWWIWGYWISPMMYAQNAISVNEFLGHSWSQQFANQNITLGEAILTGYGLFKEKYWFWIGVGALFGYAIVLNFLFTLFLTLLNRKFVLTSWTQTT